jgi:hypothetical protein
MAARIGRRAEPVGDLEQLGREVVDRIAAVVQPAPFRRRVVRVV